MCIACLLIWVGFAWLRRATGNAGALRLECRNAAAPAAGPSATFRTEALKALLQNAAENYKENAKIMSALDDKAQKTITTAGIFLAASFAFLKPESIHSLAVALSLNFLILLAITIAIFTLCVGGCLFEMWLTATPVALPFKIAQKLTDDILQFEGQLDKSALEEALSVEQLRIWEHTLKSQIAINRKKAHRLLFAQCSLSCGILLLAAMLIYIVVVELTSVPQL